MRLEDIIQILKHRNDVLGVNFISCNLVDLIEGIACNNDCSKCKYNSYRCSYNIGNDLV